MAKKVHCWEIFKCQEGNCPAFQSKSTRCWLVSETCYHSDVQDTFIEKMEICLECTIFQSNIDSSHLKETFSLLSKQIRQYKNRVNNQRKELSDIRSHINNSLSESCEILHQLSTGDFSPNITVISDNETIAKLQSLLNHTQTYLRELTDQYYELATGIHQQYDVLEKIASGDFSVRAPENSKNKMISKLGKLINKESSALIKRLQDMETTSVELAVGLSINFEVLKKVADGNLTVKAPEDSENEMLAKLGAVVNSTIENLRQSWNELQESNRQLEQELKERKRTEATLRESEEKYKTIAENVNVGIFRNTPGPKGRFIEANNAVIHMFNYESKDEFLKTHVSELYKEPERRKKFNKKMMDKGYVKDEELLLKRNDGTTFWGSVTAVSVIDENGKVQYYDGIIEDITERKMAEKKQSQLLKELEKVNSELKDFAYIVSHDLKAPLRAIGSLVNWISTDYRDKFDEEGKETVNLLIGRVRRMNDLIEGILQYSRVGRIKEDMEKVDLNQLVANVIDLVAPPEHIQVNIRDPLPTIQCEKTRVVQIFQNLLSNAVKYMNKPEGIIEIGCKRENGLLKFSVSDNGPGIEKKYHEKIFQIFQTLSPRDEIESTGVGLSLVKKIVELYKGKIWIESVVGSGSTFYFTLPN